MILVPTLSRANSRESYDLFPLPHLRLDAPARARPSLSVEGRAPAVKPAPGLQSAYAGHDATMGEITYSSAEWLTERSKRAWLFVTVRINFHYVTDRLLCQPRVPAGSPALLYSTECHHSDSVWRLCKALPPQPRSGEQEIDGPLYQSLGSFFVVRIT